jgi:hypothetical protein
MSDEELRKFGKAARYMVSPTANMGKPPLPTFVLQLEEARAEWRKRRPDFHLRRTLLDVTGEQVRGSRSCGCGCRLDKGLHGYRLVILDIEDGI